jgi:hypothetical protein
MLIKETVHADIAKHAGNNGKELYAIGHSQDLLSIAFAIRINRQKPICLKPIERDTYHLFH